MKANSWHGRLALYYGPLNRRDLQDIDICKYTRAVLTGSWRALLVCLGLAFCALSVLSTLFHVFFYFAYGLVLAKIEHDIFAALGILPVAVVFAVALLFCWVFAEQQAKAWKRRRETAREERGFLAQAADAKLNKYCFKLSFSDLNS